MQIVIRDLTKLPEFSSLEEALFQGTKKDTQIFANHTGSIRKIVSSIKKTNLESCTQQIHINHQWCSKLKTTNLGVNKNRPLFMKHGCLYNLSDKSEHSYN